MFNFKNTPEWVLSAVRQGVSALGLLLTGLNLVETSVFDQLAPLFVAIALIVYDVLRTREIEVQKDFQTEAALLNGDRVIALAQENAKLALAIPAPANAKPAAKRKTPAKKKTTEA